MCGLGNAENDNALIFGAIGEIMRGCDVQDVTKVNMYWEKLTTFLRCVCYCVEIFAVIL